MTTMGLSDFEFSDYLNTEIGKRARAYDVENPKVWELFTRFAEMVKGRGYNHYSSNAIFERIRWEIEIETSGDIFKMNNNYRAYYARKLMLRPDFQKFFEIRDFKGRVPLHKFVD